MAEILPAQKALSRALELLAAGEVLAIPTETVYGLAADATNGAAVARIYEAKRRPRFNPLIAHVADIAMAEEQVTFDPLSRRLAEAFWPGPLTLVLPLKGTASVHKLATAGLDTLAVRRPRGFAAELIAGLGRPLSAPSANSSGRVSPTTAAHVAADLGDRIPLIVDGGAAPVGVESTIVKVEGEKVRLLRPGGVAADEIEAVAGRPLLRGSDGAIEAPGMMSSHYAPAARLRLDATEVREGEALLAFGPKRAVHADRAVVVENLSPAGDLREAAAALFAAMQRLDAARAGVVAVEPIPIEGLGEAINDRLRRAAAPRDNGGDRA